MVSTGEKATHFKVSANLHLTLTNCLFIRYQPSDNSPKQIGPIEPDSIRITHGGGGFIPTFFDPLQQQGLISYKHLGGEMFNDYFEFRLIDSNRPEPNVSPVMRVDIKVTPVDDLPPQVGATGNTL